MTDNCPLVPAVGGQSQGYRSQCMLMGSFKRAATISSEGVKVYHPLSERAEPSSMMIRSLAATERPLRHRIATDHQQPLRKNAKSQTYHWRWFSTMVTMACCTFFCSAERLASSLPNLLVNCLMTKSESQISSPLSSTKGKSPLLERSLEWWLMF